jgi:glyoxylase-like metal-dependent hydrolase (beta-lactamase superfamily II)
LLEGGIKTNNPRGRSTRGFHLLGCIADRSRINDRREIILALGCIADRSRINDRREIILALGCIADRSRINKKKDKFAKLLQHPYNTMRIWKTKEGSKIVQVLKGRSNSYIIVKECSVILIDTGKKSAFKLLTWNMQSNNINLKDISTLILTHTHYDHCQSAKQIKSISNCNIIVSDSAAESIKNGYSKLPYGTSLPTKILSALGNIIGKQKFGYDIFKPDTFVKGDYDLSSGRGNIKIIETKGHSPDSISVIVDNEIAIVGDAMFGVFPNSIFPPFSDDTSGMVESWGKLLQTNCRIFLPGHGKEIRRNLLEEQYFKHCLK